MDTPVGDDEDSHIGDFIEDRSIAQPDEAATAYSLKENITRALESLAPREAMVIRYRFIPPRCSLQPNVIILRLKSTSSIRPFMSLRLTI